jgi:hypothetical protein
MIPPFIRTRYAVILRAGKTNQEVDTDGLRRARVAPNQGVTRQDSSDFLRVNDFQSK